MKKHSRFATAVPRSFWVWLLLGWASLSGALTNEAERLLKDLGAAEHEVREQAEQQLRQLGPVVKPWLERHKQAADPEIRWRVERLLKTLPADVRGFLERRGACRGTAREGQESVWPCVLVIEQFDAATGVFGGTVEWTSLRAVHAIEGRLQDTQLEFRETKYIRRGQALLNCEYVFALPAAGGALLAGTWKDPKTGRTGPVELDLERALAGREPKP